jgi:hypothetical protein
MREQTGEQMEIHQSRNDRSKAVEQAAASQREPFWVRTLPPVLLLLTSTAACSQSPHSPSSGSDGNRSMPLDPGCSSTDFSIQSVDEGTLTKTPNGPALVNIVINPGSTLTVIAAMGANKAEMVQRAQLVVAPPGTPADSPGPAENPDNQLAASKASGPWLANGQTVTLSWTISKDQRGNTYPLISLMQYMFSPNCTSPPPTDPSNGVAYSEYMAATIEVQ